jgi:hypothetical protein
MGPRVFFEARRETNATHGVTTMKKTFHGSCHCKKITFEFDLDLAEGTGKCNCSICWKVRYWGAMGKPADLRVLTGEDDLGTYTFGPTQRHHFCKTCGVRPFGRGHLEQLGGDYVSVSVAALDDLDPAELVAAPIALFNGRDNAWMETPAETRHL